MPEERGISPALLIIPVGLGIALAIAAVSYKALYRYGVEVYLYEIPREVKVGEGFPITVGLINKSDVPREGWLEQFIDDLGPFDLEHMTLQPSERWERTYEPFTIKEAGVHEFCWSIDTFNEDLGIVPWFLKAPQMVCRQIEAS